MVAGVVGAIFAGGFPAIGIGLTPSEHSALSGCFVAERIGDSHRLGAALAVGADRGNLYADAGALASGFSAVGVFFTDFSFAIGGTVAFVFAFVVFADFVSAFGADELLSRCHTLSGEGKGDSFESGAAFFGTGQADNFSLFGTASRLIGKW